MNVAITIQAAKLISLPLAFGVAGYGFGTSQNSVPHLYDKPANTSTPIFAKVYRVGATVVIPVAAISVVASTYLAYALPSQRLHWAAAGISTLTPLLYTAVVMMPGIQRLLTISESAVEQEKVDHNGEHVELLKSWVRQNYIRAAMFFVGAMCGLVAVVGSEAQAPTFKSL